MSDERRFSRSNDKIESYALDTNLGLVAMSVGVVAVGVLLLVYLTRKMGVFNVEQRDSAAPVNTHRVMNRQPQLLQRPGQNRRGGGGSIPRFEAGEDGAVMMMDSEGDYSDGDSMDDIAETLRNRSGKIGVKKMRKMEMKEEKRRMREAEAEARVERAKREAEDEKKRAEEAAQEEAEEARVKEEERIAEEERKKKEHEEYVQLKAQFDVEEEGYDANQSAQEAQDQLNKFIEYVKLNKVVNIEELASCFNLRSADCVARLKSLQETEQLTGILDDRGKFIYVSEEEMHNLAKFISQRGRISISELASACTSRNIISLKPMSTIAS